MQKICTFNVDEIDTWTLFTFGQSIWKKRLGLDEACKPQKKNDFGKFANRLLMEKKINFRSSKSKDNFSLTQTTLSTQGILIESWIERMLKSRKDQESIERMRKSIKRMKIRNKLRNKEVGKEFTGF